MNNIVKGRFDPRFSQVYKEFIRNYQARGEVGASVCIIVDGVKVVDLWGGTACEKEGTEWEQNTVALVWSCTKGATALCVHILADRGILDLDAPVSKYWPDFSQGDKKYVTIKQVLNHQAGLPVIRNPLKQGAFYDWEYMIKALEQEELFWKPGTRIGYHGFTFGWLLGEVVRRVTGKSIGQFFQQEIASPLGIDFWIGLSEDIEPHVAPIIIPPDPKPDAVLTPFMQAAIVEGTIQNLLFLNTGGYSTKSCNTRDAHISEIPAAGGITNARGLAAMYAPLACSGAFDGTHLVGKNTLSRMSAVSSAIDEDATLLIPRRFSLGYMKSIDNRRQPQGKRESNIWSEAAFGHTGFGGSVGFADPYARMSFGYVTRKMGASGVLDERAQKIIDEVYLSLGFESNESGFWL